MHTCMQHTIPPEAGTNVGGKPNNWWYSFNIVSGFRPALPSREQLRLPPREVYLSRPC